MNPEIDVVAADPVEADETATKFRDDATQALSAVLSGTPEVAAATVEKMTTEQKQVAVDAARAYMELLQPRETSPLHRVRAIMDSVISGSFMATSRVPWDTEKGTWICAAVIVNAIDRAATRTDE